MKKIILSILSMFCLSLAASAYTIKESKLDTDFKVFVNDGGTSKDAIKVTGSTGAVTLGTTGETTTHTINGSVAISGGSIKPNACTSATDYTITTTDGCGTVYVTTGNTNRTVTLPTASQNTGRSVTIYKVDAAGIGLLTISGATESLLIIAANESMTVSSDGTSWYLTNARYASGAYVPTPDTSFATTDVNTSTEEITKVNHGLQLAYPVLFTTTGTLPSPLALATSYYIIPTSKNTFKLASSVANAYANSAINLTTQGTGTHTLRNPGSNVTSFSHGDYTWSRNGNMITVQGYINIDPTTADTDTQLQFVLPTYRAQTAKYGAGSGIAYAAAVANQLFYRLLVVDSTQYAGLRAFPNNVSNVTVAVHFSYPIL